MYRMKWVKRITDNSFIKLRYFTVYFKFLDKKFLKNINLTLIKDSHNKIYKKLKLCIKKEA